MIKSLEKSLERIGARLTIRQQFIQDLMRDGKKESATLMVDGLTQPYEQAIIKARPVVKVKTQRKGKRNLLTPTPLTEKQSNRIAIKWIQQEASKSKVGFQQGLEKELQKIIEGNSVVLNKREQMHKQALQNRSNLVLMDRKR